MSQESPTPKGAPARDLCPVLTTIRIRVQGRLAAIDEEILDNGQSHERFAALQGERISLVEALELIATASDRGLDREARIHWLETLLRCAPQCVTRKARQRLRLIIDGLTDTTPCDPF